jgi:hypothetical protein
MADLVGKANHVRTVPIPTWVKAAARAGIDKLAPHDLRRTCAPSLPLGRRRTGPNPVPTRPRVDSDDGALPWLQAEASRRCERPIGNRTRYRLTATVARANASIRPGRLIVRVSGPSPRRARVSRICAASPFARSDSATV